MNLFLKSNRNVLIFFILLAWQSCFITAKAQDQHFYPTPWIQELHLPEFYDDIPNESCYPHPKGVLFVGKSKGLLIHENGHTEHISMGGPVYIYGDGSDTIYYTGKNDIGLIMYRGPGDYTRVSYQNRLPQEFRNFIPDGISSSKGKVYISTKQGTLQLDKGQIRKTKFAPETDLRNERDSLTWFPEPELKVTAFPGRGIMLEDHKTGLSTFIGKESGVPDKGIRQILFQQNHKLWILGPYTLHLIDFPFSLGILDPGPIETGRILASTLSGEEIILGTVRGVFSLKAVNDSRGPWHVENLIPGQGGNYHLVSGVKKRVFAAGTDFLVTCESGESNMVAQGQFTGLYALSETALICSDSRGILLYEEVEGSWNQTMIDSDLNYSFSFKGMDKGIFLICDNRVFHYSMDNSELESLEGPENEIFIELHNVNDELYLETDKHSYRIKLEDFSFEEADLPPSSRHISLARKYPILSGLGDIINIEIGDSILYVTSQDRLYLLYLNTLEGRTTHEPLYLNQISDLSIRSMGFNIRGLEFQDNPPPAFRYFLFPGDESGSEWSTDREIVIHHLKAGEYSVRAEARDLFGHISGTTEYNFRVRMPFYFKWYAISLYTLILLFILFLIRKLRLLSYQRVEKKVSQRMQRKIDAISLEKEKSDKLVADILPEKTAREIKSSGKSKWDKYERATVLFSDIQGFTRIAEEMNPEALIDELDKFFFHFDSVVDKYNIEKIKTIGDAYMAAGGIPLKNSTNPVEVVLAALEMQTYMQQLKSSKAEIWDLRIGIHTGPVIAGVVGHKKVSYDIWGDTVNTASRMESSGEPGKVNISGITYGMVKEYFICEYRGKLPVKYKGNIDMYFVTGLRPELSVDLKGLPNKRFFTKLQLLRLVDLEEKVINTILVNLPEKYVFHRMEHAKKVYDQTFLLSRAEETEQDERLLVRTAALMLFTGLTQAYSNFENRSTVISREILPDYMYSEQQIDKICNLILATKLPYQPHNQLEKILIDAKMEYLGRADFSEQAQLLFQETRSAGMNLNGQQFKKQQLEILYSFEFYTTAGKRLREISGEEQMERLEGERWI